MFIIILVKLYFSISQLRAMPKVQVARNKKELRMKERLDRDRNLAIIIMLFVGKFFCV